MKKLLFFAAFMLLAGVGMNAQSDSKKSCNKPCSHTEKAQASVTEGASTALMAAEKDENIQVKTCETSGNVSFYRKDVCGESGKVSYTEVEYLEGSGAFAVKAENVEEAATEAVKTEVKKSSCSSKTSAEKAACSSKAKSSKSCCSSSKSASKAKASCSPASKAGKSCCKPGASKKSCSSKS